MDPGHKLEIDAEDAARCNTGECDGAKDGQYLHRLIGTVGYARHIPSHGNGHKTVEMRGKAPEIEWIRDFPARTARINHYPCHLTKAEAVIAPVVKATSLNGD
jgi:hypothetical protein